MTVARGDERSRTIAEVVAEVNALHAEGYQEAVLTGVHLGGYGSDLGADLRALVAALLAETSIPRLRLSSLEPFDLSASFFDLWADSQGRLMPHLHLPAQSGSDAVLRRMARRNRVADFEALVAAARAAIPGLTVTTDLIAGFPGETEDDFNETLDFARRVGFAHIHAFPYSARQGTAAARFGGQVPEVERKRRVRALVELDAELGAAVRRSFIGEIRPVLWENRDVSPAGRRCRTLAASPQKTAPEYQRESACLVRSDRQLSARAGRRTRRDGFAQPHHPRAPALRLEGDVLVGRNRDDRTTGDNTMTLEERLDADLKDAMKSGDTTRKLAIRAVKTAITEAKVSGTEAKTVNDADVLAIITKQVKQRRDSIIEYNKGGRPDLAAQEQAEIAVLEVYLPEQLSEAEIRERAQAVIAELGVTDMKGFGSVMKRLSADLRGIADGQIINRVVRELLGG